MAYDKISSGPSDDWRKESDHRTIMDASKILVDRVRMRGVMDHMKKCDAAESTMKKMIAGYRKKGRLV